jgi:hypothetical protein
MIPRRSTSQALFRWVDPGFLRERNAQVQQILPLDEREQPRAALASVSQIRLQVAPALLGQSLT